MDLIRNLNRDLTNNLKVHGFETRPGVSNGLWLGLLIPFIFLLSILKYTTNDFYKIAASISFGLFLSSVHFIKLWSVTPSITKSKSSGDLVPTLMIFIASYYFYNTDFYISVSHAFTATYMFRSLVLYASKNCPKCFSVGELLLVSQGIVIFSYCAILDIIMTHDNTPKSYIDVSTAILEVGLLLVTGNVIVLHKLGIQDALTFAILLTATFISLVSILHIVLNCSPFIWIIYNILGRPLQSYMVVYWSGCVGVAFMIVVTQIQKSNKATTATRKWFHVIAVLIYLPGILFDPILTYFASGIALGAIVTLETLRKMNSSTIGEYLNSGFESFADEKDVGGLSLTAIYLLVAMSSPLVILPQSNNSLLPYMAGVLSVGIGDSAASIIGMEFGQTKWPGSSRSVEGTIANIASQVIVLIALRATGFIEALGAGALISVMVNSLVEAKTDQVDNLALPFVTLAVFLIIPESLLAI